MSWQSVPGYGETDLRALQEAQGITQFRAASGWYQVINGILVQGGIVSVGLNATLVVPFETAIPQQILGIFLTPIIAGIGNGYGAVDPAGTDLQQFSLVNTGPAKDYYWLALGV